MRKRIAELQDRGMLKASYFMANGQYILSKGERWVTFYISTGTVMHLGKRVGTGLERALRILGVDNNASKENSHRADIRSEGWQG